MKAKNRIITAVLLSAGAAVGTALINKYIKMSAVSRNLLAQPEPRCYRWRLGNITIQRPEQENHFFSFMI